MNNKEFGPLYAEKILKHAFGESDESVVERFVKSPYWQYFCGFEYFLPQGVLGARWLLIHHSEEDTGDPGRLLAPVAAWNGFIRDDYLLAWKRK